MTRTNSDLHRDAVADAAGGSSETYEYACDDCGKMMEVAEGAIRMAQGEIYCDSCRPRGAW